MTNLQHAHALPSLSSIPDQLSVTRDDICWHNIAPDRVRLEVTVTNARLERSRRTEMRLQAAPLGAFLPWRDIGTLWVPPLGPSEAMTLSTEISCPRPRPLGRFSRVPPERLLIALGLADDDDSDGCNRPWARKIRQWGRRLLPQTEPAALPRKFSITP
jgi:hypothetical protein